MSMMHVNINSDFVPRIDSNSGSDIISHLPTARNKVHDPELCVALLAQHSFTCRIVNMIRHSVQHSAKMISSGSHVTKVSALAFNHHRALTNKNLFSLVSESCPKA